MPGKQFPKEALYNVGIKAAILREDRRILTLNITRKNSTNTYWDLPGGRILDGETPQITLAREIEEETGITEFTIKRHLITTISGVRLPIFDEKKVGVIFSIYECTTSSTQEEPEERITMHWCTIADAVANLRTSSDWPEDAVDKIEQLLPVA